MSAHWFKPKKYGWGLQPVSWQGWVATLCLCALILISFYLNIHVHFMNGIKPTLKDWLRFGPDVVVLSALFVVIFKNKTDGKLKWRWGKDE
ncbi:MAG: hypothetical protein J7L54_06835 [Elusimicrobia bacterium]|nr:hypothetical protein [Elusimicrobiota bacterium]